MSNRFNNEIFEQLTWQVESGADELIEEESQNRLETESPLSDDCNRQPANKASNNVDSELNISEKIAQSNSYNILTPNEICSTCNSIKELASAIKAYKGCSLHRTATNTVVFDGNPKAKLMIIGEAPGAEEDRSGRPFVGNAGKLLDRMLAAIDLNRNDCYITNILYWRPPGNRTPTTDEINLCKPFVKRQIEIVDPSVIILAGGISAKALLDRPEGITRLRGKWYQISTSAKLKPKYAIAMFHPAYLLRQPQAKREAWEDLQEVRKKLAITS